MRKFGRYLILAIGLVVLLFTLLVAWPAPHAPLPDESDSLLIEQVSIVDVENGTLTAPRNVEVRDGVITAVGPDLRADDLVKLDARGAYLVPGFWDMHVHTFQSSPQLHLPLWVANGVTNVRDMMDCPGESDSLIACVDDKRRWNNASARGRLVAPRIVEIASYYLESPDMTAATAAARVDTYDERGLDAIKVYNRLSLGAYSSVAKEVRSRNLRLVGHLPKAVSLPAAVEAGQSGFEHAHLLPRHCSSLDEDWRSGRLDRLSPTELTESFVSKHDTAICADAISMLADAGAWIVPTHVTREEDARAGDPAFSTDSRLDYLDPLSRWAWNDDLAGTLGSYPGKRGENALKAYFEHGLRLTGLAHEGGVGVLVGTDTAIGGFRYHDEMAHLVSAGMTPAQVLRAATFDAAKYAGEEARAGSIAVGKRADMVLLKANPLEDIANTRRISAVIQGGRLHDRDDLDALLAFVRGQARAPHNWAKLLWSLARSSVNSEL